MWKPKPGKEYVFVRLSAGSVADWARFVAYEDGTGGRLPSDPSVALFDGNWKRDLDELLAKGYREVGEAKRAGELCDDWTPEKLKLKP